MRRRSRIAIFVAMLALAALIGWLWPRAPKPKAITVTGADGEVEEVASVEEVVKAYTESVPEARRLTFFGPFRSYAHLDQVEAHLQQAGYEPKLVRHDEPVPQGVPPSDMDILTTVDYRHLDQKGTLELQFFNDRLYQAEFEPDDEDVDAYREKFRAIWTQLHREQSGRSEYVNGPLRIASSLDLAVSQVGQALRTRPFVMWQDLRLIKQRDNWDQQFAEAAVH
ncbi:hypothetical protein [Solimonas marina]|uniref:Uncharacterized protein n=1 Tax=Solimonas marina TaxID=2714601 RepID=A0A969W610_9GAMM|nr:hypothetical protein [Solimonas marina]NKF21072.1 hypothetical protein [Solimonas marina]